MNERMSVRRNDNADKNSTEGSRLSRLTPPALALLGLISGTNVADAQDRVTQTQLGDSIRVIGDVVDQLNSPESRKKIEQGLRDAGKIGEKTAIEVLVPALDQLLQGLRERGKQLEEKQ